MSNCVCGTKSPASLLRATDRVVPANSVWLVAFALLASLGFARPAPAAIGHLAKLASQAAPLLASQVAIQPGEEQPSGFQLPALLPPVEPQPVQPQPVQPPAVQPPGVAPPGVAPPRFQPPGFQPAAAKPPVAPPQATEQQTRAVLNDVLSQPDFRRLRSMADLVPKAPQAPNPTVSPGFFRWLWNLLPSFPNVPGVGLNGLKEVATALGWGIVALLVAAVIWLIIKAVNAYRWRLRNRFQPLPNFEQQTLELPPGDIPADEFRQRAEHLAQQQLFGEAIAQLLLGSMSQMERSELIRFRRGLTYRDYLRALRGHPRHRDAFRAMVQTYLPIGFGRRPATPTQYQEAAAHYDQAFAQPIVTTPPASETPVETPVEAAVSG